MGKDAMTPLERAKALREGRTVDRLRCVPTITNTAARVIGVKVSELRTNPATLAKATIASYRRFGYDTVRVLTDLFIQPEAMGSKVQVPDDETAYLLSPAISDVDQLDRLVVHDPKKDGYLPGLLTATKMVLDELGHEVSVTCGLLGPYTLASQLVGAESLTRWMINNPEAAHKCISLACEASCRLADAIIALGSSPSLTCAMSSSTVISPKHFEVFSQPYLKRLVDHIKSRGVPGVGLHICGKTNKIWNGMAETGAVTLSIDNMANLEEAKNQVGDKVCLMGNVPPSEVLLLGTPAHVRKAALKCIREAWDNPKGFILASGCSLPTETPFVNIDAMLDTAREIGWPVNIDKLS